MRLWVAYGTSLTAEKSGFLWRQCGGSWITLLREYIQTREGDDSMFINRSRWGANSRWGIKNIVSRTLSIRPDVVFLEFAINDADVRRKISLTESRDNLEGMIMLTREYNIETEIYLLTTHYPSGRHLDARPALYEYYQMYREVAAQQSIGVVDLLARWGTDSPARRYMPDGIHTNEKAAREIILPAVLSSLNM